MPAPYAWLPEASAAAHCQTTADAVADARAAAADLVETARPDLPWAAWDAASSPAESGAPGRIVYGALLLTNRLWSRRSTPAGTRPSYDGATAGAVITSHDPDAARLLGIGRHRKITPGELG